MQPSDVAELLTRANAYMAMKVGSTAPVTAEAVAVWHEELTANNCHQPHIARRALSDHFRSPEGQYGITPQQLINAYHRIARRLVDVYDQRVPITPPDQVTEYLQERRDGIRRFLADESNMAVLDRAQPLAIESGATIAPDVAEFIGRSWKRELPKRTTADPERMAQARAEIEALRQRQEEVTE